MLLPEIMKRMNAVWTKGEKVRMDGIEYYVVYAFDMSMAMLSNAPSLPEELTVRLVRTDQVISLQPAGALSPRIDPEIIAAAAERLNSPHDHTAGLSPEENTAYSRWRRTGTAMNLYLADNDDVFPYVQSQASMFAELHPYVQDWETFRHPVPGARLMFNMNLAGVDLSTIRNPSRVPMFYESAFWPDETRLVVYVDSSVHWIDIDEWPDVERQLQTTWPKKVGVNPLPADHGLARVPDWLKGNN